MNLILIDSEFVALIRNFLQRIIIAIAGQNYSNKYLELLYEVSVRVVSSLITVKLYENFKSNDFVKSKIVLLLIVAFAFFMGQDLISKFYSFVNKDDDDDTDTPSS